MTINNYFTIKWQQVTQSTFMYGSQISFNEQGVTFKNSLMPSGVVIHEWNMMTNYSTDKVTPTLPILKRGTNYYFNFDFEVTPQTGVYFKIIFYRKNKTIIDTHVIQTTDCKITYPSEAFSYKIQMINAASDSLLFRNITIFENEQDIDTQTMNISTLMNEAVENQVRNIILTEPSNNDASISKDAIRHIQNVIVVNDWYTENLATNIQQLKQFCAGLNSEIHIIGYGPHSNIAARAIGQKLRCKTFVTYHEDKGLIDKMGVIHK